MNKTKINLDEIVVTHAGCIGSHPGFPLIVEANHYFLQNGFGPNSSGLIHNSYEAIFAGNVDDYVGVLVFDKIQYTSIVWVYIAFVKENYRRTGILKMMMKRLKERSEELGCNIIQLGVGVNNKLSQTSFESFGFKPKVIEYEISTIQLKD